MLDTRQDVYSGFISGITFIIGSIVEYEAEQQGLKSESNQRE